LRLELLTVRVAEIRWLFLSDRNNLVPLSEVNSMMSFCSKHMKSRFRALALLLLFAFVCLADQKPTVGTIVSMQSVDCGSKKDGKKSTSLTCQQYLVHTDTTEYQIRQKKPESQEVLHANTQIQFVLDKDKMKFKVNGKKYEYLVVGTAALGAK